MDVSETESRSVMPNSLQPHGVHGILQARILEWVAFPFSRGSSQPREQTQVSHIAGRFFTSWATRMRFGPKRRLSAKKIDAFEPCCCRRLLRVPWTAWRSNQSTLKEINPEYSLEGLKLKLQFFGHLMWRADSLEKTLMLRKTEGRRRRGRQRMRWLDGSLTQWTWVWASSRSWWRTGKPGMLQSMGCQSQTGLSNWTATRKSLDQIRFCHCQQIKSGLKVTFWYI